MRDHRDRACLASIHKGLRLLPKPKMGQGTRRSRKRRRKHISKNIQVRYTDRSLG